MTLEVTRGMCIDLWTVVKYQSQQNIFEISKVLMSLSYITIVQDPYDFSAAESFRPLALNSKKSCTIVIKDDCTRPVPNDKKKFFATDYSL